MILGEPSALLRRCAHHCSVVVWSTLHSSCI